MLLSHYELNADKIQHIKARTPCSWRFREKLSLPILKKYRQVLAFISTPDTTFLSLWNKKSYNLEKIQDHWSIRLNDQRRLEIAFGKDGEILVVDILQISNHYKEIIR